MRAEECSFVLALEQSRPVLAAELGATPAAQPTAQLQVSSWYCDCVF